MEGNKIQISKEDLEYFIKMKEGFLITAQELTMATLKVDELRQRASVFIQKERDFIEQLYDKYNIPREQNLTVDIENNALVAV